MKPNCLTLEALEARRLMHGEHAFHTHHDAIPNYVEHPTNETVQAGSWFDAATWSNGVPDAGDDVIVGHRVTIEPSAPLQSDFDGNGVVDRQDLVKWALSFELDNGGDANGDGVTNLSDFLTWQTELGKTATPAAAIVEDVLVHAGSGELVVNRGAELKVQTLTVIGTLETHGNIVFRDATIDTEFDPGQYGHGLLVIGGTFKADGAYFTSENPAGTRGHILATGRSDVEVRDSLFEHLGRTTNDPLDSTSGSHVGTNQIGRYTFHAHHLIGPEGLSEDQPQFIIENNEFRHGLKWGVAIHGSSYGLIKDNYIHHVDGSGLVFEDGNEFGNKVIGNYISHVTASGQGIQSRTNGIVDFGHEGAGLWMRGIANDFIDNVVENSKFGVVVWGRFQPEDQLPAYKGADPMVQYVRVPHTEQHGHVWENQIVRHAQVGASLQGIYEESRGVFIAKNWQMTDVRVGIDGSYSDTLRFEGGTFVCSHSFAAELGFVSRIETDGVHVTAPLGVKIATNGYLKDSTFVGKQGVIVELEKTISQRPIVLDGVVGTIAYVKGDWFNKRDYTIAHNVLVYNHNGVEGDNFQLWLNEQHPDWVMPDHQSNRGKRTTIEPGLTNQQLWDKYKAPFAGRLLPVDIATTRPGVTGWVTPILDDLEAPQITGLTLTVTDTTATIRVTTSEPAYVRIEYNAGNITVEEYTNVMPATDLATEHEIVLTGLKPGTKYQFVARLTDPSGNVGGDIKLGGLKYVTRTFTTKK